MTFHQGLGTYHDKADRMVALVEAMGERGACQEEHRGRRARRRGWPRPTSRRSMVREFPELQGTMGASTWAAGRARRTWRRPCAGTTTRSRSEKTRPAARISRRRRCRVFAAVSLVDKLDTLAGYFGLGLAPRAAAIPSACAGPAGSAARVLDFWAPGGECAEPARAGQRGRRWATGPRSSGRPPRS